MDNENEPNALSQLKRVRHSEIPVHIPTNVRRSLIMAAGANGAGAALWLAFGEPFSVILTPIGIIGLLTVAGVLIASRAYTRPVKLRVHRLAWLSTIPATVNVVGMALVVVAAIVVVALVVTGLMIAFAILGAMLRR